MKALTATLVLLLTTLSAFAQFQPQGAHVLMYFPQLVDGGSISERWQTTFTFVNPSDSISASVTLNTIQNNGSPLSMDLGSGSTSRHVITIPPSGSRILRSRSISSTTIVGWALATSSVPIQAIASYRQSVSGVVKQEISAQPTLPTLLYKSPANRSLGVAIANPYVDVSISVNLQFNDSEGRKLGDSVRVTVPASGHTAFVLGERFPNLGNISGVLTITAVDGPRDNFVAWTLAADEVGIFSTMPPGAYSWPVSHWDRIWLVYLDVANAAVKNGYLSSIPELRIQSEPQVNAYAQGGETVVIYLALSQLISDSPSELAFAIGHELGHIYQFRNGGRRLYHTNPEFDADVWGTLLALASGYDPYGAAGALAKLAMATGKAGLTMQFEDQLSGDAHKSFNSRLEFVFESLSAACNSNETVKTSCDEYKRIIHPNFPPSTPLLPRKLIP